MASLMYLSRISDCSQCRLSWLEKEHYRMSYLQPASHPIPDYQHYRHKPYAENSVCVCGEMVDVDADLGSQHFSGVRALYIP